MLETQRSRPSGTALNGLVSSPLTIAFPSNSSMMGSCAEVVPLFLAIAMVSLGVVGARCPNEPTTIAREDPDSLNVDGDGAVVRVLLGLLDRRVEVLPAG